RYRPFASSNTLSRATARTLNQIGVRNHSGHGLLVSAACADKEANDSDDLIAAITGHQHESAADLNDVDRQQLAREADAKRVAARVNNGGGLICKSAKSVNKGGTKP